jgi:hypothetical protein
LAHFREEADKRWLLEIVLDWGDSVHGASQAHEGKDKASKGYRREHARKHHGWWRK